MLVAASSFASAQDIYSQALTFGSNVLGFSEALIFNQVDVDAADILNVEYIYSLSTSGGQFVIDNDSS